MRVTGDDQVGYAVASAELLAEIVVQLFQCGPMRFDALCKHLEMPMGLLEPCMLWLLKYDLAHITRRAGGQA